MEFLPIVSTLVSVGLLGIGYLIKRTIFKEIDSLNIKIGNLEKEMASMKMNYLDRFEKVIKTANDNHIETIRNFGEVKEMIAEIRTTQNRRTKK